MSVQYSHEGSEIVNNSDLQKLQKAAQLMKENLQRLQTQWDDVKKVASSVLPLSQCLGPNDVVVTRQALQSLAAESDQVKMLLPKLVNKNLVSAFARLTKMEADLKQTEESKESLESEVVHWKTQVETAVADAQREKRDQLELRVDVQELTSQLSQQSEFCSSLGAACCTLLWRVSRQEDSIHDIVTGTKSAEFLELVSISVQSYLTAYKDDTWPDQKTNEAVFIIALCGTATNVAASAYGREHLATSKQGQEVINTFITFVGEAPVDKSANMKKLMLMALFNISINQKGIKFLLSKPGLVAMLGWHLKEEVNTDCRSNTLRLLMSLISDEASGLRMMHELKENLSTSLLQQLTTAPQEELRDLALDVLMDIRRFESEQ